MAFCFTTGIWFFQNRIIPLYISNNLILGEFTSPVYGPLTPTKNEYLKHVYDRKYDCKEYGQTCEDRRSKAKEYTQSYYNQATEQENSAHGNEGCWNAEYVTGTSYVDPRPTGDDRYIDYLTGNKTQTRVEYFDSANNLAVDPGPARREAGNFSWKIIVQLSEKQNSSKNSTFG